MNCNLKWNSFKDHLLETFQEIGNYGNFSDVTLVSDDLKQTKAHKFVLSSSSPVLKTLLSNIPHKNPLLFLRGIKQSELKAILNFIYFGETEIQESRIKDFIDAANDLQIKEIGNEREESKDCISSIKGLKINIKTEIVACKQTSMDKAEEETTELPIPNSHENSEKVTENHEKLVCDLCSDNFDTKWKLNQHTQIIHEGKNFFCFQCSISFVFRPDYGKHMRDVHSRFQVKNFQGFSCNQCDYTAKAKKQVKVHIASKHFGVRYPCTNCEYKAASKTLLRSHQRSIHEKIKFDCSKCDKQFSTSANKSAHVQSIHEGKKHICDQCGYMTAHPRNLKNHKEKMHA